MDQRAALASPWAATSAAGNLIPFALVGVAAVGLVVEASEQSNDDLRGVLLVGAGAAAGALAAAAYGRLEHDPDRAARARIRAWAVIRLFLAFEMVRYGVAKIVGMQFYPRYYQLDTRPLDMHPMTLAWTFFGKRYGYQAAAGVVEIGSAALLCFRRTATLGACLLLTVLANVVILDFSYDIPVKLFASVYLVMTLYVLALDARRFWEFFLGEGPVPARAYPRPAPGRAWPPRPPRRPGAGAAEAASRHRPQGVPAPGCSIPEALEGMWPRGPGRRRRRRAAGGTRRGTRCTSRRATMDHVRAGGRRFVFGAEIDLAAHTLRLSRLGGGGRREGPSPGRTRSMTAPFASRGSRDGLPFSVDLTREFPR